MTWTTTIEEAALTDGVPKAVRAGAKQVMLVKLDGVVHATDLACPHQGYPLTQGTVSGPVITCCRHEFRFDLRDGSCLKGAESLPTWPTRVHNGKIQLDLTRDPSAVQAAALTSLSDATRRGQLGQGLRDVVRYLHAAGSPNTLLGWLASDDGARGEWSVTHVTPLAAELLAYVTGDLERDTRLIALALELTMQSNVRLPSHLRPEPIVVSKTAWLAAVEARDLPTALAGLHPEHALDWLTEAALQHLTGFGHNLIHVLAARDLAPHLIDPTGLHHGLVRMLVDGTREDTLPEWRTAQRALAKLDLDAAWAAVDHPSTPTDDTSDFETALRTNKRPLRSLQAHLNKGTSYEALLHAVARVASHRLLVFDRTIHDDPTLSEGWLHLTHRLTHAEALCRMADTHRGPGLITALHHAAFFVAQAAAVDGPTQSHISPLRAADLLEDLLNDAVPTPIMYTHQLKTLIAAERLAVRLGDPLPILAASRYARDPGPTRRVARDVHGAVRLVRDGLTPLRRIH